MPKAKPYQSISIFGNTARYTQSCNYIHTRVRNMGVSDSTFLSLILDSHFFLQCCHTLSPNSRTKMKIDFISSKKFCPVFFVILPASFFQRIFRFATLPRSKSKIFCQIDPEFFPAITFLIFHPAPPPSPEVNKNTPIFFSRPYIFSKIGRPPTPSITFECSHQSHIIIKVSVFYYIVDPVKQITREFKK